jgi:hypothetical protein
MKPLSHTIRLFLLLGLTACGVEKADSNVMDFRSNSGGGTMCTQEAVSSLMVSAKVPAGWDGQALMDALKVEARNEGGAVPLNPFSDEPSVLNYVAYEETGTFSVRVTLGSVSEVLSNFVIKKDSSGCHAVGRTITVEFLPPNRIVLTPGN